MSSVDYASVVADLSEKRDAIDAIIGGFQRLLGTTPPPEAKPAPATLPPVAKKDRRSFSARAVDPAKLAKARAIAEREGLPAASKATGISYATLYGRSKAEKWKVPGRAERKPAAIQTDHAGPIPAGRVGGKLRVCHKCSQKTIHDPCAHCGAPWNRERA